MRLPHLAVRLAEHSRRALAFAERLEQACHHEAAMRNRGY